MTTMTTSTTDTCRGCAGTCCTGVGSDPCTCEPEDTMAELTLVWGPADIGKLFGVPRGTVNGWLQRYSKDRSAAEILKAPSFPEPDIQYGVDRPNFGWYPSREAEIRAWHASRPGPGAGGGRPPRAVPTA